MKNANLFIALGNLSQAIREISLGSVEDSVILAAGAELIRNWNDHNSDDPIDTPAELAAWQDETGIPL